MPRLEPDLLVVDFQKTEVHFVGFLSALNGGEEENKRDREKE
jgi:hypothetical protein